jgi:hypothetical protein
MDDSKDEVVTASEMRVQLFKAVGPNALLLGVVCLVAATVDYHGHDWWWLLIPAALPIGLATGALVDMLIALILTLVLEPRGRNTGSWKLLLLLGIPFWLLAAAIQIWA